jgi:exosortase/archaeosortase family protein
MLKKLLTISDISRILVKLLPLLSFILPIIILYFLDPMVFEKTWKGRIFYIFFLWLVSLETILGWEKNKAQKIKRLRSIRTIAFVLALLLPTIYVVVANFCGLNDLIVDLATKNNIVDPWVSAMPLSTEYLVFTALFALIIMLEYGIEGLKSHAISTVFLGTIGALYMIDNVYPNGKFTPFQIIVPTTATLAANLLSFMGYRIKWYPTIDGMPDLKVTNPQGTSSARFLIAWPCSGVESLLIYSVTILLFLKNSTISWKQRIVYFAFGAAVTYFINILRIVTIFIIGINGGDPMAFHDYYGQLYSITWITSYPLLIIGSRALWGKIRTNATIAVDSVPTRQPQPSQLDSA